MLLAVDLGLKAGLACYGPDGRLAWYRSTSFGTFTRLKRGIPSVLDEVPGLSLLALEGDRHMAELWSKLAEKRGARTLIVRPEQWRERLLLPRQRRSGADAKQTALSVARQVIEESGAKRPTSLNDDVAEAILIGRYGVMLAGWA